MKVLSPRQIETAARWWGDELSKRIEMGKEQLCRVRDAIRFQLQMGLDSIMPVIQFDHVPDNVLDTALQSADIRLQEEIDWKSCMHFDGDGAQVSDGDRYPWKELIDGE